MVPLHVHGFLDHRKRIVCRNELLLAIHGLDASRPLHDLSE